MDSIYKYGIIVLSLIDIVIGIVNYCFRIKKKHKFFSNKQIMILILIGANAAVGINYKFGDEQYKDLAFGFLYTFYTYLIYIFASKIIKGPNGRIKLRLFLVSMILFITCVTLFNMFIDTNDDEVDNKEKICKKNKQFSIIRATGFIEQILFYFVARKMRKKMIIQNQYDLMLDSRLKKLTGLVISCFLSGLILFAENIISMSRQDCIKSNYKQLYNFLTIIIAGIIPSQLCFIIFWPPKKQLTISQQSAETQTQTYYKNLIMKKDSRESKTVLQSESQRSAISM